MRYASIREMDISNGIGIGISLFVQGCHFNCPGCFNEETHNFNGGKQWGLETKQAFLQLANKKIIKRISILGGEPLAKENLQDVLALIEDIKKTYKDKKIWLYSGYTFEEIFNSESADMKVRQEIVKNCDVFVDGRFIESLKDINLKFRGSSNQRLIDVAKSLDGEIKTLDV